jgi:hypothetical protein
MANHIGKTNKIACINHDGSVNISFMHSMPGSNFITKLSLSMPSHPNNGNITSSCSDILSLQGIVSNVIAYLPWRQQYLTCHLVSKVWCAAADEDRTEPITLRVEDRDPCQTWRFPEKYHLKGKEFKDSSFPLWRVPVMPDKVAS